MPQLAQTRQIRKLYKQTFEIKTKGRVTYRHTLLVNPQDISQEEPSRTTVTQTLGGAYVSFFGEGLKQVTMNVLTGYHARANTEGKITDGYQELRNFRNKVYRDFLKTKDPSIQMFWYDWENEEYYEVVPTSFRVMRNRAEPLLYRFELQFVCIQQLVGGSAPKRPSTNLLSAVDALGKAKNLLNSSSNMSEILLKL